MNVRCEWNINSFPSPLFTRRAQHTYDDDTSYLFLFLSQSAENFRCHEKSKNTGERKIWFALKWQMDLVIESLALGGIKFIVCVWHNEEWRLFVDGCDRKTNEKTFFFSPSFMKDECCLRGWAGLFVLIIPMNSLWLRKKNFRLDFSLEKWQMLI